MSDVSNVLNGYGVQLEGKAHDTFGAVVGDYTRQSGLGALSDPIMASVINGQPVVRTVGGVLDLFGLNTIDGLLGTQKFWQSPTYAADLVAYAPKHRFIFKVKFVFNDPYSRINKEFMYVVKQIDKPKVTFEYEDINMYNFRTKVLKTIRHEPLQMMFHDDIQNKVLDFFNAYRVAHSPVSSMSYNQAAKLESAGMDFYQPGLLGRNSASIGVLENNQKNILNRIEVIQVYAHGTRQNTFIFTNPRIENFDFDNLDHEGSEGNALSVSFNYDTLYIKDDVTRGTPAPIWGKSDILGNSERSNPKTLGNNIGNTISNVVSSIPNMFSSVGSVIKSAFPTPTNKAVSSNYSVNDIGNSTLSKVKPSVNQSTAGIKNFGSDFDIG